MPWTPLGELTEIPYRPIAGFDGGRFAGDKEKEGI